MRLLALLLVCLLVAGPASAGKVYRWVDAQGRVHYGDRPAPGARDLQQLDTPRPAAGAAAVSEIEATPEALESEAIARAEACAGKREQLKNFETATVLIEKDNLGREREYTAAERARLLERARAEVQNLCENGGNPPG